MTDDSNDPAAQVRRRYVDAARDYWADGTRTAGTARAAAARRAEELGIPAAEVAGWDDEARRSIGY
jgi:hypothetical protein